MTDKSISVTEVTEQISELLSKNFNSNIVINGEISNLKISNGNSYFTLKDSGASINTIMWNNKIEFINGDNVIVTGKINLYRKTGNYNIVVSKIVKVGQGDIYQAYEKKKELFFKKGYFDETNKKKIKNNIEKIGIVTATEGAAIKDILYVLKKNNFMGKVIIKNCKVQGCNSGKSISDSIDYFSKQDEKVDILLITRGGGSFEDLMGFSEDIVIEAIHKCPILTMSAVGHEIDTMLSDYVADIRAPTPSIAGEVICRYQKYNIHLLNEFSNEIKLQNQKIFDKLDEYENILSQYKLQLKSTNIGGIIDDKISQLKCMLNKCNEIVDNTLTSYENKLETLKIDLSRYDNKKMLDNGYCLIVDNEYNIIETKKKFKKSKNIKIIFKDGEIDLK